MGLLGLIPFEVVVNNFAKREGCIVGICDASPLALDTARSTPFVSRDHLKRTDPAASLPGVKSIVVVGVQPKPRDFPPMPDGAGILSVLGVAEDYHVAVRALLKKLVAELLLHTTFMHKILVDSPTLDERALAVRAGLGFIGRSGLVITPEFGSRFNIGLLLMDIEMKSSSGADNAGYISPASGKGMPVAICPPDCKNCVKACPGGALSVPGGLDAARCISYLTQKDDLTPEESALIGCRLYGCDVCQDVCPFNRPQPVAWANPEDWLSMSDAELVKVYGHTAMLWRGTALLKRNAKIAISYTHK